MNVAVGKQLIKNYLGPPSWTTVTDFDTDEKRSISVFLS